MPPKLKSETWLDEKGIQQALEEASIHPVQQMANEVEAAAKTSMIQGGVSVRRSKVRRRGRYRKIVDHVPSKPGTPPHSQSGTGKRSIQWAWVGRSRTAIVGPTSPPAGYMGIHEFGGRNHPARPFMRPAMLKVAPRYPKMYKNLPLSKTKAGRRLRREQKARMKKQGG